MSGLYWQVDKLRQELETRKVRVEGDEKEMLVKKKELDQLKNEETLLQTKLNSCKKEVENLSSNLGQTQLQISQVKTQLISLEEYENQLQEGSKDLTAAIAGKDFHNLTRLLSRTLTPPPELEPVCVITTPFDPDPHFVIKNRKHPQVGLIRTRLKMQTSVVNFRAILSLARIPSKEVRYSFRTADFITSTICKHQRIHSARVQVALWLLGSLRIRSLAILSVPLHFRIHLRLTTHLIHSEHCLYLR